MTILLTIWSFHLWLSWKENSLDYQWQPLFKINVIYNIDINILANKCLKIMRAFKIFAESLLSLLISWFYMKLELSVKQMHPGIQHTCKYYFFHYYVKNTSRKIKISKYQTCLLKLSDMFYCWKKIGLCSLNICIYFHSTF